MAAANVFYLAAMASFSRKLAAVTAMRVVLVGDGVMLAVVVLAGYHLFHLHRATQALLAERSLLVAQQKQILRISYSGFRLYFILMMALGVLMEALAGFVRL